MVSLPAAQGMPGSAAYWMQQTQPEEWPPQSSSLRADRPSDGSYSTTWARGAALSKSLQLTVRLGRAASPGAAPRSTPFGRRSPLPDPSSCCPAGAPAGCCCWCGWRWIAPAAAERSSAAASKGEVKVNGPWSELLPPLTGRGGWLGGLLPGTSCCPNAAASALLGPACARAAAGAAAASCFVGGCRGGSPARLPAALAAAAGPGSGAEGEEAGGVSATGTAAGGTAEPLNMSGG